MHDPLTVAFEIKNPFAKKDGNYRPSIITIWHRDPEYYGNDDSCGWFKRAGHGDKNILIEIKKEYAFNFKHNYWFNDGGYPKFSTIGIAINLYKTAGWIVFKGDRKKLNKFMKENLYHIINFAENPFDSLHSYIHMTFGVVKAEDRINEFASIIYGDILRQQQKWYQHPRWHIHHWRLQFHPYQNLKRRYWDKCNICGKRGFKNGSAHGDSNGGIWHYECGRSMIKSVEPSNPTHP